MSRFKIGQKVVCVKTHSQGVVIKGKIYTVKGHKCCSAIDVGVTMNIDGYDIEECPTCRKQMTLTPIWHMGEHRFAPLKEDGSTAELNLCIEEFELETIEYN